MSIKNDKKTYLKTGMKIGAFATAIAAVTKLPMNKVSRSMGLGLMAALGAATLISAPAHAISESSVQAYAAAMNQAANSQNIGQISRLISDEVIISLTRNGKTANLDKNGYLQLLQKSWAKSDNYRYNIGISDVVITGNQARAQVETTETWTENGKPVKLITTSRATLSESGSNAVLIRSVSQVTIN